MQQAAFTMLKKMDKEKWVTVGPTFTLTVQTYASFAVNTCLKSILISQDTVANLAIAFHGGNAENVLSLLLLLWKWWHLPLPCMSKYT